MEPVSKKKVIVTIPIYAKYKTVPVGEVIFNFV
jgi:hypothetical protein